MGTKKSKTKFPATAKALTQDLPGAPATVASEATPAATPKKEAKDAKKAKPAKDAKPAKGMSALDAAAKVLGEADAPMSTSEMIEAMSRQGYWTSPNGATPAATLYAAILREMKTKGPAARFMKTARGKFALVGTK